MTDKKKCTIYAEMHLVFDNDFDVNEISKILGIEPTECKCRWETRKSPLTNKQIEGFWTIKSKEMDEWDIKVILNDLLSLFSHKITEIKEICEKNDGTVLFDIVPSFSHDLTPALYFDREFLDIVHFLNATVQIDMYVE
jgi:hypothetical protein